MIVISNGFNKFHLSVAAAEMERRAMLSCFITGAYPFPVLEKFLNLAGLKHQSKISRLMNRKDNIYPGLITTLFTPEFVYALGLRMGRVHGLASTGEKLERAGFRYYGKMSISPVKRAAESGAKIFHYRAGFGGESVSVAKKSGLFALCDHSIAHPGTMKYLIENKGHLPAREDSCQVTGIWSDILQDIEQADAVLVNSLFVKQTFIDRGWKPESVHVIYWGLDDGFMNIIPKPSINKGYGRFRFLFAGSFDKRKGADDLMRSLALLENDNWELRISGSVSSEIKNIFHEELKDPRIVQLGWLSRENLASEMVNADAFVFPSLAEGSARVVFEALACGCYVITTANSGTVVKDGVHGRLVGPGSPNALAKAIEEVMLISTEHIKEVGFRNAKEVREGYIQSRYGDQLCELYNSLLGK